MESKVKTKVIDGKQKCVRVEYIYEMDTKSESDKEDSVSASKSPESPVVVQKGKCKRNEKKDSDTQPKDKKAWVSKALESAKDMENVQSETLNKEVIMLLQLHL